VSTLLLVALLETSPIIPINSNVNIDPVTKNITTNSSPDFDRTTDSGTAILLDKVEIPKDVKDDKNNIVDKIIIKNNNE
jgi:hypothetical protein